jgi:hypothetical protein
MGDIQEEDRREDDIGTWVNDIHRTEEKYSHVSYVLLCINFRWWYILGE